MSCKRITYQNFDFLEVVHRKNATAFKKNRCNGDHLGNIRLSYSDADNNGIIAQSEIIEENNYYPFGLKHKGYNNAITSTNIAQKFKYNGKELEEGLGYNMYEMDMRSYDPAIARWTSIDPVTHHSMSTYNAFDNNPVFWADPSGADSQLDPDKIAYVVVYSEDSDKTKPADTTTSATTISYEHKGDGVHVVTQSQTQRTSKHKKNKDGTVTRTSSTLTTVTKATITLTQNDKGGINDDISTTQTTSLTTETATLEYNSSMYSWDQTDSVSNTQIVQPKTEISVGELNQSNAHLAGYIGGVINHSIIASDINATIYNQPLSRLGSLFGTSGLLTGVLEVTGNSLGRIAPYYAAASVGYGLGEEKRKYFPRTKGILYSDSKTTIHK